MIYYRAEAFLKQPIGNNRIDFEERKNIGSDCILRIPPLIKGTIDNVQLVPTSEGGEDQKHNPLYYGHLPQRTNLAYEYINEKGGLVYDYGLEHLIEIHNPKSETNNPIIYIIDNHNHAFYCRWKSYLEGKISRGSHLIHIDQHSDLNEMSLRGTKQSIINKNSTLEQIANYTNEILDIASFIKPAKEIGLISEYEMILTEYSLLQLSTTFNDFQQFGSIVLDIDLDFRAPEMSIEHYDQTINQVRKLISLPQVQCITIATSPTYIDQTFAIKILYDILR